MSGETITVRIDSEWKKKIEKLAAEQRETKSDLIRKALMDYIEKKEERKEIERSAAKKFASGKISFEELSRITGYEKARKIAFYVKTAERSFEEGLS